MPFTDIPAASPVTATPAEVVAAAGGARRGGHVRRGQAGAGVVADPGRRRDPERRRDPGRRGGGGRGLPGGPRARRRQGVRAGVPGGAQAALAPAGAEAAARGLGHVPGLGQQRGRPRAALPRQPPLAAVGLLRRAAGAHHAVGSSVGQGRPSNPASLYSVFGETLSCLLVKATPSPRNAEFSSISNRSSVTPLAPCRNLSHVVHFVLVSIPCHR